MIQLWRGGGEDEERGISFRLPTGTRISLVSKAQTGFDTHGVSYSLDPGGVLSPGPKRLKLEADYSALSSAEVRMRVATSTSHCKFMA